MTAMGESSLVNIGCDAAGPDSRGLFQQRLFGEPLRNGWTRAARRRCSSRRWSRCRTISPSSRRSPRTRRSATQIRTTTRRTGGLRCRFVATLTADPSLLEKLPVTGPIAGCSGLGPGDPLPAGDGSGSAIVAAAQHYAGTPYSWGGGNTKGPSLGIYQSPSLDGSHIVGFDCSGLVIYAVSNATGISLDHSAESRGMTLVGGLCPATGRRCSLATSSRSARTGPELLARSVTWGSTWAAAR